MLRRLAFFGVRRGAERATWMVRDDAVWQRVAEIPTNARLLTAEELRRQPYAAEGR